MIYPSHVHLVTDDVSIEERELATLTFVALAYKGLDQWKSRRGVTSLLVTGSNGTAGVRLDKHGLRVDDEKSYAQYQTLEMLLDDERGTNTHFPLCV